MKLVQKQLFKCSREFEIIEDTVFVCIKSLFREEKSTVGLSTLDPEPVNDGTELVFFSRYQGRPVLSLLLDKPNSEEFNAFVETLKQHITGEDTGFTSAEKTTSESSQAEAPGWNVYEEPPEFDESREKSRFEPVNAERLEEDLSMLRTYLDEADIKTLMDSLEILKAEPQNEAAFQKVVEAFNDLGFNQGAVLTYAPYLKVLLSKYIL